jgi:co-chaperonin GroES (HSP10)
MNNLKPVGKLIVLERDFGGRKTTEAGIIYDDKVTNKMVWSKVIAIGNQITEDIKVGDRALWDITKIKGIHNGYDVVHQNDIYMISRD